MQVKTWSMITRFLTVKLEATENAIANVKQTTGRSVVTGKKPKSARRYNPHSTQVYSGNLYKSIREEQRANRD